MVGMCECECVCVGGGSGGGGEEGSANTLFSGIFLTVFYTDKL